MNINTTVSTTMWKILNSNKNFQSNIASANEMTPDNSVEEDKTNVISEPTFHPTEFASFNSSTTVFDWNFSVNQTALATLLIVFCLITVFGNVLVMVAIFKQQYLHTVTNYFIASLATADCLVGAVVMPFSAIHEVLDKYWLFGREWCDLWRSLDVLASTASILNLCAISIDRYWAITDPMTYPAKMTPIRAKAIVAAVWLCSALISFPAIAWWRAVSVQPYPENQCLFTNDVGYLLFSSVISFYGPLAVMLFTYYKIYKAAVRQTKSLKLGMKHIRGTKEPCRSMTLRIHRGGVHEENSPENGKRKRQLVLSATPTSTTGETSRARSPENTIPMRFANRHVKAFSLSKN
ncbi:dopamine receptor 2 [Caerostris extrusa]|uniref:Dopamine receptor 2 n=1 Tax=Caerostris extrusa TaxID=172846 RepID=A0AAV4Y3P1_CAEEX|nr:dopamine receptor 2 [Caerostris extrusa]